MFLELVQDNPDFDIDQFPFAFLLRLKMIFQEKGDVLFGNITGRKAVQEVIDDFPAENFMEDLGFFRIHARGLSGGQDHGLEFACHAPILELQRSKVNSFICAV